MPAPDSVLALVERFREHRDEYLSAGYNEATLRKEFLEPMFKALGWDLDNTKGYSEAYKEVIHEDAIKISGATKAPDYAFRLGGVRKFFVEAKKPSVDLKGDPSPAYQLRRYAWSAKLPLSILTDFHEFAVYDCTMEPDPADRATTGRILYFTCEEYAEHWDEIAELFSPEAIQKGAFDKHAASAKKKGTTTVDDAFLREIETWRDLLARNLALRNPDLTQRELNTAVQTTIDRIIFLRICEDRGIEEYGALRGLLNGTCIYGRMLAVFRAADERYNSGLFHFRSENARPGEPDTLTPGLTIDDRALKEILEVLYYPKSPYEFSVLPADILGHVYEQFLGKVIRLTAGHRVVVEEKPEVKKAGGVYYTPTYIVDYIVKNTVGKLLEGMTPKEAGSLRILDPACGSGSFLLGAYQFLLNWHQAWYAGHDPEKWARGRGPKVFRGQDGEWRLTTAERKRILLDCIYGVDIDPQAVEVTKLSLLLKVLEGEDAESIGKTLKLLRERALPDLGKNIQCGNSLIGTDFYDEHLIDPLTEEERYRINAFDWEAAFPQIMKSGGFDVVIGNPPWGALLAELELEYLRKRNREIIVRMIDSFMFFVHQGSAKLHTRGLFGMILPDVVLYQTDNQKLRQFILSEFGVERVLNLGNVFDKVTRPACILILRRGQAPDQLVRAADLSRIPKEDKPREIGTEARLTGLPQSSIRDVPGSAFVISSLAQYDIWKRIQSVPYQKLGDLVDEDGIQRGASPDLKEAFLVDSQTADILGLEAHKLRKVLTGGKHVKRYSINRPDLLLVYTNREDSFQELPNIRAYIDGFRSRITCKEVEEKKHSIYALHRARREGIFLKPRKLLGVVTEDEIVLALDEDRTFATDGLYLFGVRDTVDIRYVMGILNSQLFVAVYRLLALESGRALAQVKPTVLAQLPIRAIDFSSGAETTRHDQVVRLVDVIGSLYGQLTAARTDHERIVLERQIEATDRQIDGLVYELYGLTDNEIRIVEEEAK